MASEAILIFPYDVIANILAWLPPKHVARARLVCKQWHALTSDHHFVHTNFLRCRTGNSIAGFFLSNKLHRKFSYNPLPHDTTSHLTPDLSFIPCAPHTVPGEIYVTNSCNGLLIFRRPADNKVVINRARYYACNPATKKFTGIDMPQEDTGSNMNVAYDPSKSEHYKIVTCGFTKLQVYSL